MPAWAEQERLRDAVNVLQTSNLSARLNSVRKDKQIIRSSCVFTLGGKCQNQFVASQGEVVHLRETALLTAGQNLKSQPLPREFPASRANRRLHIAGRRQKEPLTPNDCQLECRFVDCKRAAA